MVIREWRMDKDIFAKIVLLATKHRTTTHIILNRLLAKALRDEEV